jgi:uncharacterized protein YdeI (YjbR/CyaY-like superfamily)
MKAIFFESPADFRRCLEEHQNSAAELWVGYYKKGSGKLSISWPESVDEALCMGWIDGIRKGIDETSYAIRFTPRKPRSIWSAVNIARAQSLMEAGRMQPAGLRAFQNRREDRSRLYSYEQPSVALDGESEQVFMSNPEAWNFFQTQAPWYRKAASWWVMSAKKEETRRKRLGQIIADSAQGRTIRSLTRNRPIGNTSQD